jgi:hypothetical protein
MEYKMRAYPIFSACGLNCGLCPRYHTEGKSKCPGCAGEGFCAVHPTCGVLSCSLRKGLEYCFLCDEFLCKKYDSADAADSFITHKNQFKDLDKVKLIGLDAYIAEQNEKIEILRDLLSNYNDGRLKSFFCVAVNLLELSDVRSAMKQIKIEADPEDPAKGKSKTAVCLFQNMADNRNISLKLRKKN